jgi:hypothetical protein
VPGVAGGKPVRAAVPGRPRQGVGRGATESPPYSSPLTIADLQSEKNSKSEQLRLIAGYGFDVFRKITFSSEGNVSILKRIRWSDDSTTKYFIWTKTYNHNT